MVKGHSTATSRRGGALRTLGTLLAAGALVLQALMPLADASWHARHDARGGPAWALVHSAKTSPLKAPTQPATADAVCQLCIGLQAASGPVPTAALALAVPVAYRTELPPRAARVVPAARLAVAPQPRAPPVQV